MALLYILLTLFLHLVLARVKETLSTYIKRLEQLEDLANSFEGVKKGLCIASWTRDSCHC